MKTIPTTARYTTAFWNAMRNRLYDIAALDERRGYLGASIVPSQDEETMREELAKRNIFRQIATVVQVDSMACTVAVLAPIGSAAFIPDNAKVPESNADHASIAIESHKIAQIIRITNALMKDAGFDLRGALMKEFGRSFGTVEENGCINGGGISEPYGVLHPEQGAEMGPTAAGTDALTFDDIAKLYFSLGRDYRRDAVWLMSDATAYALRTLKGSTGGHLWWQSDDTIFGRPVYTSPFMPDVTAGAKPVLFGDFSYYWLFERGGALINPIHELYAPNGQTGFLGMEQIDGHLVKRETVKALQMAREA